MGGFEAEKDGARAVRATAVLWRLIAWIKERSPCCLHLVAAECVVPAVKQLLAAQPPRREEAAHLAANFEIHLAAMYGPHHEDVRLLSLARVPKHEPLSSCHRVVTCTACSVRLVDARVNCTNLEEMKSGSLLQTAEWCSRCHLAPFCSQSCEATA